MPSVYRTHWISAFFALAPCLVLVSCTIPGVQLKTAEADFELRQDVIFTPAGWPKALPANVYVPRRNEPGPGVLLVHGGSWTNKDRRKEMEPIARRLVRRGYAVMNVHYRGTPDFSYPAAVEDLRIAAAWMRRHSSELGVEPDRLAVFGYSAGGHLAALLGATGSVGTERFQAVIAGGAPSDLRKFTGGDVVPAFLGGRINEVPGVFTEASPIVHVSADDPPVFLYHGDRDETVPPDHSADYAAALNAAGVPCEVYWIRGRGHVLAFLTQGNAVNAGIDFLDRHLR